MKSHKAKSHRMHHRHHTVKKAKSTGAPSIALLVLLALVVLVLGVVVLGKNDLMSMFSFMKPAPDEDIAMEQQVTPTVRPKPRTLTQGIETFKYSPGPMARGPKISEFSLDPMDPKVGQAQKITVKLNYTGPITSVTARLDTDNKKTALTFTRIEGTESSGTWQATRTEDDTHDYTYYLDFTLVGSPDTYTGGFAFR